jgi:hypothetical protein
MMKKIILSIFIASIFIVMSFLCACDEGNCEIKRPKDLKPVDWNNYNDVYTVYWNYYGEYGEFVADTTLGKNIKVYGRIHQSSFRYDSFYLLVDPKDTFASTFYEGITIECFDSVQKEILRRKFDSADITRKCYLTGIIGGNIIYTPCDVFVPHIRIDNADSLYFE